MSTEEHATAKPAVVKKRKRKTPRCDADGCRRKLMISTTFSCSACTGKYCPKHRYASEHGCADVIAREQRKALEAKLLNSHAVPQKV